MLFPPRKKETFKLLKKKQFKNDKIEWQNILGLKYYKEISWCSPGEKAETEKSDYYEKKPTLHILMGKNV